MLSPCTSPALAPASNLNAAGLVHKYLRPPQLGAMVARFPTTTSRQRRLSFPRAVFSSPLKLPPPHPRPH